MKKENLKKEMDFWVKRLMSIQDSSMNVIGLLQKKIERLEKTVESLERYNKRTVHPNLIYLRDKTEKI